MITGLFEFARRNVDGASDRSIIQGGSQVVVVNSPTAIALKGARTVVPPAKVAALLGKLAKHIGKAQLQDCLQSCPLVVGGHNVFLATLGVVDVAVFQGNVEVATNQNLRLLASLAAQRLKILTQDLQPTQFVNVLVAPNFGAVGHIQVHDADAIQHSRNYSFLLIQITHQR